VVVQLLEGAERLPLPVERIRAALKAHYVDNAGTIYWAGTGRMTPFVQRLSNAADDGVEAVMLPRLSHLQYARTAQAFLLLPTTPTVELRGDSIAKDSFETDYRNRIVDKVLIEQYKALAESLADSVVGNNEAYDRFIAEAGAGNAETRLKTLLASAWPRAYRRPLTDSEITRYAKLGLESPDASAAGNDDDKLRAAVSVLIRMTLQSPHFIYRIELGDPEKEEKIGNATVRPLSSNEYATRLSYVLFDAPPDKDLLSRATELDSDAGREALVSKMLDDTRSQGTLLAFHRSLYLVDISRSMRKDDGFFPGMYGFGPVSSTDAYLF